MSIPAIHSRIRGRKYIAIIQTRERHGPEFQLLTQPMAAQKWKGTNRKANHLIDEYLERKDKGEDVSSTAMDVDGDGSSDEESEEGEEKEEEGTPAAPQGGESKWMFFFGDHAAFHIKPQFEATTLISAYHILALPSY